VLASPLTIIERSGDSSDMEAITSIIHQHQVERVIVGLPRSMDGSIGRQAEKVKSFAQELRNQSQAPVEFRDERLTTVAARRLMREVTPGRSRRGVRDDAVAAALILQGYLDEMHE